VTTQDGWPVAEATVTVLDATGRQVARTATDASGVFRSTVPGSSAVTVILAAPGHLPQARAAQVPPRGSFDLSQVVLARAEEAVLPATGLWTIDPAHSIVRATARHLGLSRVEGRFTAFEGTIRVADPVEASAVEVSIAAASIDTANTDRDAHLRSADFLDAEQFPSLTYRSTGVVRHDDEHWTIHGLLTIRDITREVPLDVTYAGTAPDPWGGTRMAFVASAQLARADYEMRWNMGLPTGLALVGPTLRIDLEVQAVRRQPDAASPGTLPAQ
jgi:polyisoprenoid-binding protein YceI